VFEELHSSSVSFLQKYDLVREEQNNLIIFSSEREYFRDAGLKINNYSNTHKENGRFSKEKHRL